MIITERNMGLSLLTVSALVVQARNIKSVMEDLGDKKLENIIEA